MPTHGSAEETASMLTIDPTLSACCLIPSVNPATSAAELQMNSFCKWSRDSQSVTQSERQSDGQRPDQPPGRSVDRSERRTCGQIDRHCPSLVPPCLCVCPTCSVMCCPALHPPRAAGWPAVSQSVSQSASQSELYCFASTQHCSSIHSFICSFN